MEHATYFDTFLKNEVNLSQSSLDLLVERVDAVYDALKQDDTVGSLITGKIPQGSWPHRLIIKPRPGGEFDADFLLEMNRQDDWEPKTYLNEVYTVIPSTQNKTTAASAAVSTSSMRPRTMSAATWTSFRSSRFRTEGASSSTAT